MKRSMPESMIDRNGTWGTDLELFLATKMLKLIFSFIVIPYFHGSNFRVIGLFTDMIPIH